MGQSGTIASGIALVWRKLYMLDGPFPIVRILLTALVYGVLVHGWECSPSWVHLGDASLLIVETAAGAAWKLWFVNLSLIAWHWILLCLFTSRLVLQEDTTTRIEQAVYDGALYLPILGLCLGLLYSSWPDYYAIGSPPSFYHREIVPILQNLTRFAVVLVPLWAVFKRTRIVYERLDERISHPLAATLGTIATVDSWYVVYILVRVAPRMFFMS